MVSQKRLKNIWRNMKSRCYDQTHVSYKYYGFRGINVCTEWLNSFEIFCIWAISNGYKDDLTLDRTNVNGNYEPNNCTWQTRTIQQNNRRDNIRAEVGGKILTPSELAQETGCSYMAAYLKISRINKKRISNLNHAKS